MKARLATGYWASGWSINMPDRGADFASKGTICLIGMLIVVSNVHSIWARPLRPAAFDFANIYDLRQNDPNLTGQDITIASVCRSMTYTNGQPQGDYGVNDSHKCFNDSDIQIAKSETGTVKNSDHATAIGAIIVGSDPNASSIFEPSFEYQGVAPKAQIDIHEFWRFIRNHVFSKQPLDADIVTMSVGIAFEDWWTRGIDNVAQRQGKVIVAAAGNGTDVYEPILYPAGGSNVIAVGLVPSAGRTSEGSMEFSLPQSAKSSTGPTADGRCTPDLVAPGNCIVPDANNVSGYRMSGDWTSYATPLVTGTCALLTQKANSEPALQKATSSPAGNCVIKAILLNSARKLPFWHKGNPTKQDDNKKPLDLLQGAGLLDANAALSQLTAGQAPPGSLNPTGWDNGRIERSGMIENVYAFRKPENENSFFATLVWNRHYQNKYPFAQEPDHQSDLRLELWAIDPDNPDKTYMIDHSDSRIDNVEHICSRLDPNYVEYELIVTCNKPGQSTSTMNDRKVEPYGLAWKTSDHIWEQNKWWNDLNCDGSIDRFDSLAYSILARYPEMLTGKSKMASMVKLTPIQLTLLKANWENWKDFFSFE